MIPELLLLCIILLILNSISKSTSHFKSHSKLCDNLLKYTINTLGEEIIAICCLDKGFWHIGH